MKIMNKKDIVRKKIKEIRENLKIEEKHRLSSIIIEKFLNLEEIKKSKVIMSYMDFKNEVETRELNKKLLKIGKKVLVPKIYENDKIVPVVLKDEYEIGKYGIIESKGESFLENRIDIIIVPGIAFNERGDRIGFGKGYYDRFFSEYFKKNKIILKISLLYDFQIDNSFVGENHDEKIDILITEQRIIKL